MYYTLEFIILFSRPFGLKIQKASEKALELLKDHIKLHVMLQFPLRFRIS